jgi:hypothetical protein
LNDEFEIKRSTLKDYIFNDSRNKKYVLIAIISIIIQLLFFKYWYPFASFINGDSYKYIASAYFNFDIDVYPIGYSKFLRLFSVFTRSDTVLVVFQYVLLQLSALSFVFTIFYFYKPSNVSKLLLFGFILFNPIFLYLANYISSDSIFLSLSLIWFNLLIWNIYQPNFKNIVFNAIVLFLLFTIRYNALYYPIILMVAFLLYREKALLKVWGVAIVVLLGAIFIQFNKNKYYELTGHNQFAPFSGWQLANNAMYAYRYVDNKDVKKVPARFYTLNKVIRDYYDSTRNNINHPEEKWRASTIYMWTPSAPLRTYLKIIFKMDAENENEFKSWATIAPLYSDFGFFIIKEYPLYFIKYYMAANAIRYYAPPVEYLGQYSTGVDHVQPIAKYWFRYKSEKLYTIFKDFKVNVLFFFPVLIAVLNILFFLGMVSFLILGGFSLNKKLGKVIKLVLLFWLVNLSFSVFASPITLRFQLFPMIVIVAFTILLFEYIVQIVKNE